MVKTIRVEVNYNMHNIKELAEVDVESIKINSRKNEAKFLIILKSTDSRLYFFYMCFLL